MHRHKKSKRSHASYVKAGKKAARSRKRRKSGNTGSKHKITVYATGRGKNKRLRRAKNYRLKPRRVNPKRRRRNPVNFRSMTRGVFGKARLTNALMLLVGIGGAGALKVFAAGFFNAGTTKDWFQRLYGVAAIMLGASLNMRGRRKETKAVGTGMVVFGIYDVLVSNIEQLRAWLPAIAAPTALLPAGDEVTGDYRSYGSMTGMGTDINSGPIEVVGSNITAGEMPEIVGDGDLDLADALDMAA